MAHEKIKAVEPGNGHKPQKITPLGRSHRVGNLAYPSTWALLGLAFGFPFALMVLDPTLMFKRGWEQYLGTGIFLWAIATLAFELYLLGQNEKAFLNAARLLQLPDSISHTDNRILPSRIRQLSAHASGSVPVVQLMELNRETSSLDQEHAHGRFTLCRYILYLLPVIGFIGTVEGISQALMNISKVLPMVKDLDGFLSNLTGVTSALQIAFDSTLLALFLSASLMLVQTLVIRRSDDFLARVDGWVVENMLPRLASHSATANEFELLISPLERLREEIAAQSSRSTEAVQALAQELGKGLAANIDRFSCAVDRLPVALGQLEVGTSAVGRLEPVLSSLAESSKSAQSSSEILTRIEKLLESTTQPDPSIDAIRRGVDRAGMAIDSLSDHWSAAFEKNSRTTQEQLAKTLGSLKDALELLNVSMEQGNTLYRSIVKRLVSYQGLDDHSAAA